MIDGPGTHPLPPVLHEESGIIPKLDPTRVAVVSLPTAKRTPRKLRNSPVTGVGTCVGETRGLVRKCVAGAPPAFDQPAKSMTTTGKVPSRPPGRGSDRPLGGEGGGNGGNGNGNGRKRKGGSGEHPAAVVENVEGMQQPTKDVLTVQHLLQKRHGIVVETPLIYETSANQREYRERLFGPQMWATIHELQQRADLKQIEQLDPVKRVEQYYAMLAAADAYKAGEIPESNIGAMFGLHGDELMDLFCSIEGDEVTRRKSIELAPGNGEISRTLMDARDKYLGLAHIRHGIPKEGRIKREHIELLYRNAFENAQNISKSIDPNISAVDLVRKFVLKARKKLINGRQADICASPEQFFEATGFEPNSADFLFMNLALDRLGDANATLRNMKLLAKMDGSTRFMFGFYAPFSPQTLSFSRSENIPEFECFDPDRDLRHRWIDLSRVETIYRIIADLNIMYGFNTKRVAEHEYEVYSAHCIAETAGVLRTDPKYAFLKDFDFNDEELNQRRADVFSGSIPDGELVGFPEREPVILISGNITLPEDGARYKQFEDDDAA